MAERTWTCQRRSQGARCGHVNPKRKHICEACGKRRSPTKKLAHRHVLDVYPYEAWVEMFGERCGICGREPEPGKRLMRDHDHRADPTDPRAMRGLLCFVCNLSLPSRMTAKWLRDAANYLEKDFIK